MKTKAENLKGRKLTINAIKTPIFDETKRFIYK